VDGAAATIDLAELPVVVTHHDPQHGVATYAAQIAATVEARTGRHLALDVADLLDVPDPDDTCSSPTGSGALLRRPRPTSSSTWPTRRRSPSPCTTCPSRRTASAT
jgi:hypothetical protein